jgi:hypothetical protein
MCGASGFLSKYNALAHAVAMTKLVQNSSEKTIRSSVVSLLSQLRGRRACASSTCASRACDSFVNTVPVRECALLPVALFAGR